MHLSKEKFSSLITLVFLVGCQSLPPIGSASDYPNYSCNQLKQEIDTIDQHAEASREAGSFGFTDFLLAFGSGIVAGHAQNKGNYAGAQKILESTQQWSEQKQTSSDTADALDSRSSLLTRLHQAKGCS